MVQEEHVFNEESHAAFIQGSTVYNIQKFKVYLQARKLKFHTITVTQK